MLNIKTTIIAVVCAIGLLSGIGYWLYDKGYSNGINYTKDQVELLNEQHKQKIDALQKSHNKQLVDVAAKYAIEVDQLTEQVKQLENNKTEYDQYIGTYIPQQQYNYVPNGFVVWHDRAAKGERLDKIVLQGQLDNPSEYTYNDAMYAIGYNYTQANVCFKRLDALQTIVRDFLAKQPK